MSNLNYFWYLIQSAKTRLGADCGSDHELLIAKFRLRLKKVGKTTGPFRYDQNQTDYILAVKDGEALYSQQKQDWELTVAQIMNFLLQNSDLN